MPREIYPDAHFLLIAERQASPRSDADVECLVGGLLASDAETNLG